MIKQIIGIQNGQMFVDTENKNRIPPDFWIEYGFIGESKGALYFRKRQGKRKAEGNYFVPARIFRAV